MTSSTPPTVIVLGLGVIGLTTSIRLLESGYKVVALASHLPSSLPLLTDPALSSASSAYASAAAGAHHLSFAANDDTRQRALDKRTFEVMQAELKNEGKSSCLLGLTQEEFYGTEGERHIEFMEGMPDFRVIPESERPTFAAHAVCFTSLTMDTGPYLQKLFTKFQTLGGISQQLTVSTLSDTLHHAPDATTIINCTGLGSLTLGGVSDRTVFPVRGQVVLLRAPWVKFGRTLQAGKLDGAEGGERTYIIPRASGDVIVGGTREKGDWHPYPRPTTTQDILRRALILCPELVPPHLRSQTTPGPGRIPKILIQGNRVPEPSDLSSIIIDNVVGFRPAREDGLRLERGEDLDNGISVVHNYGHSGAGWQCSWGCAEEVVKIVEQLGAKTK